MVYGCDAAWWAYRRGLPDFKGLRVCWAGNRLDGFQAVRRVEIAAGKKGKKSYADEIVTDSIGKIGSGGNSGFQALNLAVQWGARRVILVGFDMTDASGVHWYGRNNWTGANNPDQGNFRRWIEAFDRVAPKLAALGVEVINAAPNTALRCFPKRSIADALEGWTA